jgi:putative peptidoglycan lipid II flippase
MAVFVVPSAVGYLLLGDVIVGAMYERGDFVRADTLLVYLILGGYSIGLLASTATPLLLRVLRAAGHAHAGRIAVLRVATSAVLGGTLMVLLEPVEVRSASPSAWAAR